MSKNKIDFLNTIELKVKDLSGELIKTANITLVETDTPAAGSTTFTLSTVEEFSAGDEVYIYDGSANSKFFNIVSIDSVDTKIVVIGGNLIQPGATVKKSEAASHVLEALDKYSQIRPLEVVHEIEGDGNYIYPLPDGWDGGINLIRLVEYPAGNNPPVYLDQYDHKTFLASDGVWKIRFNTVIATGYSALITYESDHSFSGDNPFTVTAPDSDFYAICNLAAAQYLLALAARYGQSSNSTLGADVVNYDNKTDSYRRLAKEYLGMAASSLGISIKDLEGGNLETKAASSNQEVEPENRRQGIFY